MVLLVVMGSACTACSRERNLLYKVCCSWLLRFAYNVIVASEIHEVFVVVCCCCWRGRHLLLYQIRPLCLFCWRLAALFAIRTSSRSKVLKI
jgi:hypothetical protein